MSFRLLAACATALAVLLVGSSHASAATPRLVATARTFANCTQMHQTYPGGVAKPGARDRRRGGGHARYAPKVSASLYGANRKSDRDNDGVACEQ